MPYMPPRSRTKPRSVQFDVLLSKLFPALTKPRRTFYFYQIGTKFYTRYRGLWKYQFNTSTDLLSELLPREYPSIVDMFSINMQIFFVSHNPTLRYVKYKLVVNGFGARG